MTRAIAVTFDYRCPFAYNGHAAVVAAVRERRRPRRPLRPRSRSTRSTSTRASRPVWEREPGDWGTGVLALLYGIAVRDALPRPVPRRAPRTVRGAPRARRRSSATRTCCATRWRPRGLDPDAVAEEAWSGRPLKATARPEHTERSTGYAVFGVPTFIEGDEAVFVRFMERGASTTSSGSLDLLQWTRLNEFKRTRIPR